jgi:hypothetical protein
MGPLQLTLFMVDNGNGKGTAKMIANQDLKDINHEQDTVEAATVGSCPKFGRLAPESYGVD